MRAGTCSSTLIDFDGDGASVASINGVVCSGGTDCDDTNPDVSPGATEACNGIDDNCDGTVDEGCSTPPIEVPNDNCPAAAVVNLVGGRAEVTGTFAGAAGNLTACGSAGPDLVQKSA